MNPVLQSLGGFGLFLFGMGIMTSGLKKLAGDRLHQWLAKTTRTPLSGAVTGTIVTAIIQSSSATTVATVGFVGAGLMTFPQALGVVFGANIGTTITGWIVALVGFKLKLGMAALPLIFVAALLYLAKKRRVARGAGKALAGFALIFLGIEFLQSGLTGAQHLVDLSKIDAGGVGGRFMLLAAGVLLTLITQSSSAAVAASVTALHTGMIDLPQAAAFIIGADVGTTATAALATIGGNTGSRRTGFAHVIYNLITAVGAFLLLPLYLLLWHRCNPSMVDSSPEVVAVAFHSTFNLLGVLVALPFTYQFAHFIERLFPERELPLVAALDKKLLSDSKAASIALETTVRAITTEILPEAAAQLSRIRAGPPQEALRLVFLAVEEARSFAVKIGESAGGDPLNAEKLFSLLHVLDHCERLAEHTGDRPRALAYASCIELHSEGQKMAGELESLGEQIGTRKAVDILPVLEQSAATLEADHSRFRQRFIGSAAHGELSAAELDRALDGARWMRRVVFHAWRMAFYWSELDQPKPPQPQVD